LCEEHTRKAVVFQARVLMLQTKRDHLRSEHEVVKKKWMADMGCMPVEVAVASKHSPEHVEVADEASCLLFGGANIKTDWCDLLKSHKSGGIMNFCTQAPLGMSHMDNLFAGKISDVIYECLVCTCGR